jgi:hypothetical protein
VKVLILGKVWPEPSSTAAGRRTLDIITALSVVHRPFQSGVGGAHSAAQEANDCEIHFASAAQPSEHALDLCVIGVHTHAVSVNEAAFDPWIQALAPDIVIFDRFMTEEQFGWRVARHCPDALRVLDTSDLHCLRVARERALQQQTSLKLYNEIALREIASIYRSDLTLIISEFEMEVLRREFSISDALLAYWPFSVCLPRAYAAYEVRQHFMMIGSLMHPPNLDAVRWCREKIWPLIRQELPNVELHCYGSYGERYASQLDAPKQGFYFKGRADDALQTMVGYRVNLAPLRYGAGLKGKVFDGFLTGTPTVMTPIAAEGIFTAPHWSASEAKTFASVAIELYRDAQAWEMRQKSEQQVCRQRFDSEQWQPYLFEIVREAHQQLQARRDINFIGQMLCHHHHRSTEFMSRWIEAKNK